MISLEMVSNWSGMAAYDHLWGAWHREPIRADESLALTLGAVRARLLQALVTPSNTGELAQKLNVTAGAVSQHLGRLSEAGLVNSYRNGRWVYHHLTYRASGSWTFSSRAHKRAFLVFATPLLYN